MLTAVATAVVGAVATGGATSATAAVTEVTRPIEILAPIPRVTAPPVATTTRCDSVAHIGDSTSMYMWESRYVDGGAAHTMFTRYHEIGVGHVIPDDSGGRSVVERFADWQANAFETVAAIRDTGFEGCWVIMIGTNDAANVAAGANLGARQRIERMLYAIGGDPVLWVDTHTTSAASGNYRPASMRAFNAELEAVAAEHPNVEVLRWSELARPNWFLNDGVHYNPTGLAYRAALTAQALVERFPAAPQR